MSRIRVLLTVPHLTSTSSPYREMMAIARLLPRDEFELTIGSLRENGYQETGPLLDEMGVKYFVARFRPRTYGMDKIIFTLFDQIKIERNGMYDIQHSWDFTVSPFEALASRLHARHFIFTQRQMNPPSHRLYLQMKSRLATIVQTNSNATTQLIADFGISLAKVRQIYNGIDTDEMPLRDESEINQENPYIVFVGHLQPRKRQEDAIRALAQVSQEYPTLRLCLIGQDYDTPYATVLQELARELNIADRVDFMGVRTDAIELMRGAVALILCSDREALAWVLIEAMAIGTPILASAVDGSLEIIESGKDGLLVPVADIDAYAAALRRILDDPGFARSMALKARERIERDFTEKRLIKEIADMYREAVHKR